MNKSSQEQRILNYLFLGRGLTSLSALKKFGCFRLASRIHDLRQKGNVIESYPVKRNGKRFSEYYMNVGM